MRTIKSRLWDTRHQVYVDERWYAIALDGTIRIGAHDSVEQDRYIAELFTGITDRNGREIYEGDILGLGDATDQSRCIVVWHNAALKPQLLVDWDKPVFSTDWDWIVIGNIHDTPELAVKPDESEEE